MIVAGAGWPTVLAGIGAGLGGVATLLTGLVWVIRAVIRQETGPARDAAEQAARQVSTGNGHTLGQIAENTAASIAETQRLLGDLQRQVATLNAWSVRNRDTAREALQTATAALHDEAGRCPRRCGPGWEPTVVTVLTPDGPTRLCTCVETSDQDGDDDGTSTRDT